MHYAEVSISSSSASYSPAYNVECNQSNAFYTFKLAIWTCLQHSDAFLLIALLRIVYRLMSLQFMTTLANFFFPMPENVVESQTTCEAIAAGRRAIQRTEKVTNGSRTLEGWKSKKQRKMSESIEFTKGC